LSFGISRGVEEEDTVIPGEQRTQLARREDIYGMKALASVDSRDHFGGIHASSRCRANTIQSKGESDVIAAEPKHILGQAI
jgi:hypothetical protein